MLRFRDRSKHCVGIKYKQTLAKHSEMEQENYKKIKIKLINKLKRKGDEK